MKKPASTSNSRGARFLSVIEAIGVFSATQSVAQILAALLNIGGFWSCAAGIVIFLVTLLLYYFVLRPQRKQIGRYLSPTVAAVLAASCTVVIIAAGFHHKISSGC